MVSRAGIKSSRETLEERCSHEAGLGAAGHLRLQLILELIWDGLVIHCHTRASSIEAFDGIPVDLLFRLITPPREHDRRALLNI